MAYQDFIKVGKYYRFSLFLYSFKKEHYYLSEKIYHLGSNDWHSIA